MLDLGEEALQVDQDALVDALNPQYLAENEEDNDENGSGSGGSRTDL